MKKLKYAYDYFGYLKNPFSVLPFKFGLKNKCRVHIKKFDESFELSSIYALNRLMAIW